MVYQAKLYVVTPVTPNFYKLRTGNTSSPVFFYIYEREVTALLESASEELAEYDERFARVEEKLALLPEKQREVFLKCVVEEKKYQEVADELDVSINTIKKHMTRALKFLRGELQDETVLLFVLKKK